MRVGPDTEEKFDDDFWDGMDIIVNALDNVQVIANGFSIVSRLPILMTISPLFWFASLTSFFRLSWKVIPWIFSDVGLRKQTDLVELRMFFHVSRKYNVHLQ